MFRLRSGVWASDGTLVQEAEWYSMGDSVGRDSKKRGLSQLLHDAPFYPFFAKRFFPRFALLFFGMVGTFPALPTIDTKNLITFDPGASQSDQVSEGYQEELCRWQKDFSFFNDLGSNKKNTGDDVPCVVPDTVPSQAALGEEKKISSQDEDLTTLVATMAAGYPLAVMAPTIAEYDRSVAALLVGIAKKESDWGKHVPRTPDGADCFNYWGFKGAGSRGVAMGHGCFGSPEEAVHAVGHRIAELVTLRQTSEPKNLTIWKCGSSCATHSPESVRKWISDVDLYYRKIVTN